jgi:DNA-binding response OmpR family regulator
MNMETILLLEDDIAIMRANKGILELNDYRVLACYNLNEARNAMREETPDLMVLDIMLPDGTGVDFCREYREGHGMAVPVLFLTALKDNADMITGYESGGTDYLVKPFGADMLLLKVRALLESGRAKTKAATEIITVGSLRLDCMASIASYNGTDLILKPKEFAVLKYLIHNRGDYVTSDELYEKVWGMEALDKRPVKQQIKRLRDKIVGSDIAIDSEYGDGYRLVEKLQKDGI